MRQPTPKSTLFPYTTLFRSPVAKAALWSVTDAEVRKRGEQTGRSEEHTSELQSRFDLVCRLLLEKKKRKNRIMLQNVIISRKKVDVTSTNKLHTHSNTFRCI